MFGAEPHEGMHMPDDKSVDEEKALAEIVARLQERFPDTPHDDVVAAVDYAQTTFQSSEGARLRPRADREGSQGAPQRQALRTAGRPAPRLLGYPSAFHRISRIGPSFAFASMKSKESRTIRSSTAVSMSPSLRM